MAAPVRCDVVVVGTGFGGLCAASRLRRSGRDVTILEKDDRLGGTWRDNTYPGAECDVPSALYSFSFAPNPTWSFKWAKQPQILRYLEDFASQEGLDPLIRYGRQVDEARWNEAGRRWTVRAGPESYDCQHLVLALGQLHHPMTPAISGAETFNGASFHTARWDEGFEPDGKRVAVIGAAASAVQLIPELATRAERLTVYQRSPNWILPKGDRSYSAAEQALGKRIPILARAYRAAIWASAEYGLYPVIKGRRTRTAIARAAARRNLRRHVADPMLRAELTPEYAIGAKRILLSDRFYPAIARPNVELVTGPIDRVTPDGIVAGGEEREHDAIIYATGFKTNPFVPGIDVRGQGGRTLREAWADGAHAYLGVQTTGFPNLFFLYGPNTNTGHTSVVYKIEAQTEMILSLMALADQDAIGVREDAEAAFCAEMQSRMAALAWSKIDTSWYQDRGRITNNWPGSAREYRKRCLRLNPEHFAVTR